MQPQEVKKDTKPGEVVFVNFENFRGPFVSFEPFGGEGSDAQPQKVTKDVKPEDRFCEF